LQNGLIRWGFAEGEICNECAALFGTKPANAAVAQTIAPTGVEYQRFPQMKLTISKKNS
jgi:hypothetical protein